MTHGDGDQVKDIRCKILGTTKSPQYFEQEMFFASHEDVLYLRIGDDVYEGLESTDRTGETAMHFTVLCHPSASAGHDRTQEDILSDLTRTVTEYIFRPAGQFHGGIADAVPATTSTESQSEMVMDPTGKTELDEANMDVEMAPPVNARQTLAGQSAAARADTTEFYVDALLAQMDDLYKFQDLS